MSSLFETTPWLIVFQRELSEIQLKSDEIELKLDKNLARIGQIWLIFVEF